MPYLERLTLALSRRLGGRLQRVVRPIRRALSIVNAQAAP